MSSDAALQEQLDRKREVLLHDLPQGISEKLMRNIGLMKREIDLSHAVNVGDKAPDFTLPDSLGNQVSLHDRLARGPAAVSYYRGGW